MKESIGHFLLIMLSVVFLVSFVYTVMPTVKMGKNIFVRSESIVDDQVIAERSLSLTSLARQNQGIVMPVATLLSLYYSNEDFIYNIYDGRYGLSNVVDSSDYGGLDEEDIDYARAVLALAVLDKLDVGKAKIYFKENPEHTGMYDVYIHSLDCKGDLAHTGNCSEQ